MNIVKNVEIPEIFHGLFEPARYKIFYGGRGAAKSWAVARALVAIAATRPVRVLCCREYQASMHDSVHALLVGQIHELGLDAWFTVTNRAITSSVGSNFLFKGLACNIQSIKSLEAVDIVWVEEAQSIRQKSLDILVPTIRKTGSELWFTYNPDLEDTPVHKLMLSLLDHPNALIKKVSWRDNPWFPKELELERQRLLKTDPQRYDHVWEGECQSISEAVIFRDRVSVEEFEAPDGVQLYYGVDWGFARDPTALVRCFIKDENLFIDHEMFGKEIELDLLPQFFDTVPAVRDWPIYADNARPETISYMSRQGFRIYPARKWGGSVHDGIAYLKSFPRIYVHPRCKNLIQEFRLYSYRVDRATGHVLPQVEDNWNHGIDALRYALDGFVRKRNFSIPAWNELSTI